MFVRLFSLLTAEINEKAKAMKEKSDPVFLSRPTLRTGSNLKELSAMKYYSCSILMNSKTELSLKIAVDGRRGKESLMDFVLKNPSFASFVKNIFFLSWPKLTLKRNKIISGGRMRGRDLCRGWRSRGWPCCPCTRPPRPACPAWWCTSPCRRRPSGTRSRRARTLAASVSRPDLPAGLSRRLERSELAVTRRENSVVY